LFSAVVAAFIIETYKMLLPDNGGATVALLTQLVALSQPKGSTSVTDPAVPSAGTQFKPSGMAIRINIFMFISLFLGLTCALMSTLIQQWAREYLQNSQLSAPPQKRSRVRAYLFEGLTKFQMRKMVESLPVFLHISVFLFFFAVSEFLRTIDNTVGLAARCCFIVLLSAYLILSILPLVVSSSPYQTALTAPLRPCVVFLRFAFRLPMWAMKGAPRIPFRTVLSTALQNNRSRQLLADTERRAASLDYLALQWLLKDVDEENMDKFVAGLPALIHSPFITDATATMGALVADGMLERVGEHLKSSMSSREVSPATGIARAFACVEAIDAIFAVLDQSTNNPRHVGAARAASTLVKSSDVFRTRQDSAIALRAACIRALTFRKFIASLSSPAMGNFSPLTPHILPLALRLQTWACLSSRLWRNQSDLEKTELRVMSNGYNPRSTIEGEGHLINFLVLVRDVLSYVERPTLDLTSVWETLETMVSTFSITQPTASASARTRFEEVHTDVRESLYFSNKWGAHEGHNKVSTIPVSSGMGNLDRPSMGGLTTDISTLRAPHTSSEVGIAVQKSLSFYAVERYSQLLELMDKVAKGSRLVTVLSANLSQPNAMDSESPSELHLRHDQIYNKDPFGIPDVLIAFSSALPAYISSTGDDNARDTVEKMIAADGLLRSVCVHLNTSIKSEVPEPTRAHMSLTSVQILEQVFKLFDGSPNIRWYALGIEGVHNSVSNVAFSSNTVGPGSENRAHCALAIIEHAIVDNFRLRMLQGQQPTVQNFEEQLFILKIYDWLCLGDEEERQRRENRRQGHPDTNREAASPQYLRDLVKNGALKIFSNTVSRMISRLERGDTMPEIFWTTLRKLIDVPDLEHADDGVTLDLFGNVRNQARDSVISKEGNPYQGQLDILELSNIVAEKLGLPELPMPMPVAGPETTLGEFIAPNRSAYAPIYI
jgi:hypothetical protein